MYKINIMNKICTTCKIEKTIEEFHNCNKSKDLHKSNCKKCRIETTKKWNEKNKDKLKSYKRLNTEKIALYKSNWRKNNIDRVNEKKRAWKKLNKDTNPLHKLKENLRRRTLKAFKVKCWNKNNTTKEILGIEYIELFNYIENKFTEGMNWDNQGKWHIDHIIPLASAKTEEELIKLCHYTNLQPLWAIDNLKKGDKIQICYN